MNLRPLLFGASALVFAVGPASRAARRSRYSLEGKVVLITGGSRGLGLELARQFARRGSKLVLVARDAEELARAKEALAQGGASDVLTVAADLTSEHEAKQAVSSALSRFEKVDVLVNCAGQIGVGPIESMTHEDYRRAMDANFWTAQHCVDAVVGGMRARGEGRIVNIASVGGLVAVPHLLPYSASKFALTGYSLGLQAELAKDNVKVVTVCPGLMRTGSAPKATFKGRAAVEYALFKVAGSLPLLSMNAERAARRIVDATQAGEIRVVLTLPAKVAGVLQALAPSWIAAASVMAARFLPPGGQRTPSTPGERLVDLAPGRLTRLGDRASVRNNEAPGPSRQG